jgi:TetR/AcrR family transcriptional regulator, transcriptional repressor for nem operon
MGRPRSFDEAKVVREAAALFAGRSYDGISVDDLVAHLGVHRNSLYKTFGSKRGLYLTALRWYLDNEIRPLVERIGEAGTATEAASSAVGTDLTGATLDLLLMAAVERAPEDPEVAGEVGRAMDALDQAVRHLHDDSGVPGGVTEPPAPANALTATILGLRLRARAGA